MNISEQVKELKWYASYQECKKAQELMYNAADTIESLSAKLQAANMERSADCGGWIPCSEPPKDDREVLIFNGKSYSVGHYNGKTWINAIHPVEWQEIRHEP